jgi:hypothetical protein
MKREDVVQYQVSAQLCRSGAEAVPKQCRSSAEEVVGFPGRLTKNSNIANNALYLSCGK